jgi:PAS domain S-box-containing protein
VGLLGSTGDLAGLERQLAIAQEIAHTGSWEWSPATNVVRWSDELYRIYGLEPRSCEITFESFLARVHADDRQRIQANVTAATQGVGRFSYRERVLRPDGSVRELDTIGETVRDANGALIGLIGTCRDVTDEARARALQINEQRVLEGIASGRPLPEVLEMLVLAIEQHAPGTLGSIVLVESGRIRHAAAPSLDRDYVARIEGTPIGPRSGSCGTAAYLKKPVFVSDIDVDPLWEEYRAYAQPYGLRACWSTPMIATDGRCLGTFALYYRLPRTPNDDEIELIARAGHLAGIAIERRQLDDQMRALSARVESIREEERTGIAREIHDELGQALTALRMDVAWVTRRLGADSPRQIITEKLQSMSKAIDGIVDDVRRISAELRPGVLDDLGLVAALEWQAQEWEGRTGTTCIVRANIGDLAIERSLATAVFRIFQEALTNVARHAEAEHVVVTLRVSSGFLVLEVSDNGRGLEPEAVFAPTSLGLLGIRERARRLGGAALISGGPGEGTTVTLRVPVGAA